MTPFCYSTPVRFADVDHAGIVYYPVFFHYFHLTFEEFFRQRMGQRAYVDLLDEQRIGFPAVRSECEYRGPLRFGDTAEIEMSVAKLGNRSITFRFCVYRDGGEDESTGERSDSATRSARVLAAEGTTVCAVVDLESFRAVQVPAFLRQLLEPLTD